MINKVLAQSSPVPLGQEYAFGGINSLADGLGYLIGPGFAIASLAVVIYFLIGAVKWIVSGGDKNAIEGARNMITHSVIGLFLLLMMFIILQFIPEAIGLTGFKIIK